MPVPVSVVLKGAVCHNYQRRFKYIYILANIYIFKYKYWMPGSHSYRFQFNWSWEYAEHWAIKSLPGKSNAESKLRTTHLHYAVTCRFLF